MGAGLQGCSEQASHVVSCGIEMIVRATRNLAQRLPSVLMMDPVEASCRLIRRPASIRGSKFIRPNKLLLEIISGLPLTG